MKGFYKCRIDELSFWFENVSRNVQYKDVVRRTIEIPQRALIFEAHYCLKVHNAHLKLASPILG